MAIFELTKNEISGLRETTFSEIGIREREDLQRLLREKIEIISPDTLIISEEFCDWNDSTRRIDLLGINTNADLIVFELKRSEDGGHMELQAIRYAAMVSTMTLDHAVDTYKKYLSDKKQPDVDALAQILEFLGWQEPDEREFAQKVRIVLVSAEFSKEVTTSVMWLIDQGINISCVRIKPYILNSMPQQKTENSVFLDVQRIIPLPEADAYQIKLKRKRAVERISTNVDRDYTKYDISFKGRVTKALSKRNAIYRIVKYLTAQNVDPEDIKTKLSETHRQNQIWRVVDGTLNSKEYCEAAKSTTDSFDSTRWFTADDQLIHANSRTYAFSNQWGRTCHESMQALIDAYGTIYDIEFKPSHSTEDAVEL